MVAEQGELLWAAQLWGAAEALREAIGTPMPPIYQADYQQAVNSTRTRLGEDVFIKAWSQGRTMNPKHVIANHAC